MCNDASLWSCLVSQYWGAIPDSVRSYYNLYSVSTYICNVTLFVVWSCLRLVNHHNYLYLPQNYLHLLSFILGSSIESIASISPPVKHSCVVHNITYILPGNLHSLLLGLGPCFTAFWSILQEKLVTRVFVCGEVGNQLLQYSTPFLDS